jgi:hypothetical protein
MKEVQLAISVFQSALHLDQRFMYKTPMPQIAIWKSDERRLKKID